MSLRVSTTSLISGALVCGDRGLGVFAQTIPSSGQHGGGFAYKDLAFPADNGKEIRAVITAWPTQGTLKVFEDTSFTYTGPEGTHTFTYQIYRDGVASGLPKTITLFIGYDGQYARPASDITVGGWLAQPSGALNAALREIIPNDTNYIVASTATTCRLRLGKVVPPDGGVRAIKYRAFSESGTGGLRVRLYQGTTLIGEWTHASLPASPQTFVQPLLTAQDSLITDWTALEVELQAT